MLDNFIVFSFKKENKKTLIFLPGYTSGFDTPLLKGLIEYYSSREKDIDVLGINLEYQKDEPDLYTVFQEKIIKFTTKFAETYPQKEVVLVAKSLSGSLCISNSSLLKVKGLIALGFPVILGRPPKISLLSIENPKLPNYKQEWMPALINNKLPISILSGGDDDLTDNDFLNKNATDFSNIILTVLPGANQDLSNCQTGEVYLDACINQISATIRR